MRYLLLIVYIFLSAAGPSRAGRKSRSNTSPQGVPPVRSHIVPPIGVEVKNILSNIQNISDVLPTIYNNDWFVDWYAHLLDHIIEEIDSITHELDNASPDYLDMIACANGFNSFARHLTSSWGMASE